MSTSTNKKKGRTMCTVYRNRRIAAVVVAVLAVITVIKTVSFIGDFLNEDFACKQQVEITAVSGDTKSEIVSEQVQNGNCIGYEPLLHHVTNKYGSDTQVGEKITIPFKEGE